jgi:hypothetical protein
MGENSEGIRLEGVKTMPNGYKRYLRHPSCNTDFRRVAIARRPSTIPLPLASILLHLQLIHLIQNSARFPCRTLVRDATPFSTIRNQSL